MSTTCHGHSMSLDLHVCTDLCTDGATCAKCTKPQEGTMFFATGDTIPGFGTVEMMTDTGYRIVGGGFAPFVKVHPRPAVAGLVAFADGAVYGGPR